MFEPAAHALILLTSLAVPAQVPPAALKAYATVLSKHVVDGRVDYVGLRDKDQNKLNLFLTALAHMPPASQTRPELLGLYIDAYNALVLKAVIEQGPPRSVLDIKDFFDAQRATIAQHKNLSLNQLERTIIIPLAKDPRVHMVLVCGAVGCPILERVPYHGSNLDQRLDAATRRYLAEPNGVRARENWLRISKIFDWHVADFGGEPGALQFVRKYAPAALLERAGPTPKISYIDFNWTLNINAIKEDRPN